MNEIVIGFILFSPAIAALVLLNVIIIVEIQYYFKRKKMDKQLRELKEVLDNEQWERLFVAIRATNINVYHCIDTVYKKYCSVDKEKSRKEAVA